MLIPVILFVIGLVLLIRGGDAFVDGATGIAKRFKLPELLIGATVVSIGTTLPEVMVSATSAVSGHGEIAYGNAIGSIICNTSLIAALTIAIKPSKVDKKTLRFPVAFFFLAACFYIATAYGPGFFSRTTGIVLLTMFVIYMIITVRSAIKSKDPAPELESVANEKQLTPKEENAALVRDIIKLILGAAFIAVGADLLVDNGTIIAQYLGVPESVIALTFVALGTSLPELVTAITSLAKGHGALSLGNVIGANIFNLVLVSGVSTALSPFEVPQSKLVAGLNASLVMDIPIMILVMSILTIPALIRGKLSRAQGITLLTIYAGFCVAQFIA